MLYEVITGRRCARIDRVASCNARSPACPCPRALPVSRSSWVSSSRVSSAICHLRSCSGKTPLERVFASSGRARTSLMMSRCSLARRRARRKASATPLRSCSWRPLSATRCASCNRITSYNVCYTKLLRYGRRCKRACTAPSLTRSLHAYRITSYNVCYTKLLRVPVSLAVYSAEKRASLW